jgi:ribosomal protein S6
MTTSDQSRIESSEVQKIGIREFRYQLSKQLSPVPFAVTNHGRTIGYYIPITDNRASQDLSNLKQALTNMSALLKEKGISEDEIVEEFEKARKNK